MHGALYMYSGWLAARSFRGETGCSTGRAFDAAEYQILRSTLWRMNGIEQVYNVRGEILLVLNDTDVRPTYAGNSYSNTSKYVE